MTDLLLETLRCSIFSSEAVLSFVEKVLDRHGRSCVRLPGNCLYSQGTREDAVVMVAHADTVWNRRVPVPGHVTDVFDGGHFYASADDRYGIGADDRAGIAMILSLLDLGHSVLITDLEEVGMVGSRALKASQCPEFLGMQKHRFFVQFDRQGDNDFKCYDVGTDEFRSYISERTGLMEPNRYSFTDICSLCVDVPGVNVSVGYHNEHSRAEVVILDEWDSMRSRVKAWLGPVDDVRFGFKRADPLELLKESRRTPYTPLYSNGAPYFGRLDWGL